MRGLLVVLVGAALGCGPPDRPWCEEAPPLPPLHECVGCVPGVRRVEVSPDRARSFELAFVAEGFRADELPDFERQTARWLTDFKASMEPDVPGLSGMINATWVDFRYVAPPDGFALGTCGARNEFVRLQVNRERLSQLVPLDRFDVVIGVVNVSTPSRETAMFPWYGTPVVMLNSWSSSATFAHELGHSLFGLHDEYVEEEEALERVPSLASTDVDLETGFVDVFYARNVSVSATSPKFGGARAGAEGAMRHPRGAFRSGEPCLMHDGQSRLCSACRPGAVERVRARQGTSVASPLCGIRLTRPKAAPWPIEVLVAAFDWAGLSSVSMKMPGGSVTTRFPRRPMWHEERSSFVDDPQLGSTVEVRCLDGNGQVSQRVLHVPR
jgi:copper chaperone CopZ